ncbi:extracellular solute-binding protein [Streptomyces scopuliridis]|uniref:Extracellular solute-binding protein n=1 Tax=Streptomyces scopuliridis TaxID=452529 RepID=A0ACD4ZWV9_9ACTN|nr:extracellular solute-binding protein [Streptomyces scopuliridis]WSC02646.1 extracellular solute-binding protein [Streptomyces scopuliridis]WSC03822.1 extracellular solute-binding protein [Streptomyces scopuliridis]
MGLSRRGLLRAGLATTAGAALGGLTAGCSVPSGSTGRDMTLWYWTGGLSDKVVDGARTRFTEVALKPAQIGGYFKSKLLTTMAGRAYVPDITGLKGEDMASYLLNADQFIDLRTLGADKLKDRYLPWKWAEGVAPGGEVVGLPIDTGPVAHYYRPAVFERAGLPTDPADVSAELDTWDRYLAAGERLRKRVPGAHMLIDALSVYQYVIAQGTRRYVDRERRFIGDQEHVRRAWDISVEAYRRGLCSTLVTGTPDANAATEKGLLPSQFGASWAAGDLKLTVPRTEGEWRVAALPGGAANNGGSFLAITKFCREPERAFEIISWLLNPDNQTRGFVDATLFPSTPASFAQRAMREPDPYFGGQITIEVFGPAAEKVPVAYHSPYDYPLDRAVSDELTNVNALGKDPRRAWKDAMDKCRRVAAHLGVRI